VDQTFPFGDFMVDRKNKIGAHSRYYPGEWSNHVCRDQLKKATNDEKREVFDNVCANHSPVFRYFFIERFGHSIEAWHAAKMRYTRSVALNSIVGHILGIGDRHSSNILVHEGTGEVVHIDFGIVFEQGKVRMISLNAINDSKEYTTHRHFSFQQLLNTPEVVPFRLTQNTVDGFGPVGVEGAFTSAAQRTLAVLKKNSNALLTILSAIVSDPLYKWSVSPVKARLRQQLTEKGDALSKDNIDGRASSVGGAPKKSSTDSKNEAADNAIRRIQEKLQGYEDGTSGEQQSVEGQVQLLISSARDCDNLAQMFCGWAPWV
jgi:serine-protein kinase ATM